MNFIKSWIFFHCCCFKSVDWNLTKEKNTKMDIGQTSLIQYFV